LLIDRHTARVVTEQLDLPVGDCVAIERGNQNDIRLVDDARCDAAPGTRPPTAPSAACDSCAVTDERVHRRSPSPGQTAPSRA
jgi:hypothetical protein